jgi:hypothetical protein
MTTSSTYFSLTVNTQLFHPYWLMLVANVIPTNQRPATTPGVPGATLLLLNSCKECDNHRVPLLDKRGVGKPSCRNSNSA